MLPTLPANIPREDDAQLAIPYPSVIISPKSVALPVDEIDIESIVFTLTEPLACPPANRPNIPAGVTLLLAALKALGPYEFSAQTAKVYAVPLVKPVTEIGDEAADAVTSPGVDLAIYSVIAEPPTSAGAVNGTDAAASPAEAVPIVGAPGFFSGS